MGLISAPEATSTMTLNINNGINKARSDDAVAELSSSAVKSESCDLGQHDSAAPPSAGNSSPAIFINLEQQAEEGMFTRLSGMIRKGKLENEEKAEKGIFAQVLRMVKTGKLKKGEKTFNVIIAEDRSCILETDIPEKQSQLDKSKT